jgi:hypothetical protein
VTKIEENNSTGFLMSAQLYIYILRQGNENKDQGLTYYDGIQLFDHKKCRDFVLSSANVSSGVLDYCDYNKRMCF